MGLPNYLLLLLFDSIDDYPDTKILKENEYEIDFFIYDIFDKLFYSFSKIEYDELDLSNMVIKYSKSKRKRIYENIIDRLIEKDEKFKTRLFLAINHYLNKKELVLKDIEYLLNIDGMKTSIINSMKNHHNIYELCLEGRTDILEFVLEHERVENGNLFLNKNNLEFLSREKGEVLTAEDGNWIYTVPTITIKIKEAIEKNKTIPKSIKDYVLNKIDE